MADRVNSSRAPAAKRSSVTLLAPLVAIFVAAGLAGGQAAAADVTISPAGPGRRPGAFHASVDDLAARRFVEQEFFIAWSAEGTITPGDAASSHAYKIPKRFNGTVVVEWLNAVLGYDLELG